MEKNREILLIRKCREGDEKSFTQLIDAYQDPLFNFILGYTNNPEDAQDLVQESFHKAYIALAQYDPRYSFSTWIYNIARNLCIDHYRKNSSASTTVSLETEDFNSSLEFTSSPEEEMIHNQSYESLVQLIENIESPYREVAELRFVKDYPYEEIAKKLNIPLNTVRTRLYRARAILMTKLHPHP